MAYQALHSTSSYFSNFTYSLQDKYQFGKIRYVRDSDLRGVHAWSSRATRLGSGTRRARIPHGQEGNVSSLLKKNPRIIFMEGSLKIRMEKVLHQSSTDLLPMSYDRLYGPGWYPRCQL